MVGQTHPTHLLEVITLKRITFRIRTEWFHRHPKLVYHIIDISASILGGYGLVALATYWNLDLVRTLGMIVTTVAVGLSIVLLNTITKHKLGLEV